MLARLAPRRRAPDPPAAAGAALDARLLLRPGHAVRRRSPTTPSSALSYLTGSEEGRGPLFDATGDIYEGRRLAAPVGAQGVKVAGAQRRRPHARADRGAADRRAHRRPRWS